MKLHPYLRRFLGIEQIQLLIAALDRESDRSAQGNLSTLAVALAILIAALPMLSFYMDSSSQIDFSTFLVGLAACLAILYRIRADIPFGTVSEWRKSLKLTHTAFAVGCIPTLLIVIFLPEALSRLNPAMSGATPAPGGPPSTFSLSTFILGVAAWAAITEEFIYRGLLISVLRRWNAISNPRLRDSLAIVIAALIFGLAHLPKWGPVLSLALFGLGLGFGIAYIAIGELILPLVVYHLVFDALSLSFAIFANRI